MDTSIHQTGAESLFAQQSNNNATIVALVDHNGKTGWSRISILHRPEAAYCKYTYFVINSRGEEVGFNKPYIHSEQKGIALPGKWTHRSALSEAAKRAANAEIPAEHNFKTLVVIYPADAAYLTEKQREIIKSFDSREAIIERQVELVKKLQQLGAVEPLPLPMELLEELAAINVYLNLKAL